MKCPDCGAEIPADEAICHYCGSHRPATLSATATTGDRRAAFERIKRSAEYANSNSPERHARLPKHQAIHKVILFGFFGVFIGMSLFIFVMALGMGGAFGLFGSQVGGGAGGLFSLVPLLMAVVPLGMAALGVFLFLTTRKKMQTIETSPVVALAAVVADKRTHVSGGSGNSSAHTSYFVTCETEDGARQEYQVWDGNLYGRLAPQDAGILYLRSTYALDFDRV